MAAGQPTLRSGCKRLNRRGPTKAGKQLSVKKSSLLLLPGAIAVFSMPFFGIAPSPAFQNSVSVPRPHRLAVRGWVDGGVPQHVCLHPAMVACRAAKKADGAPICDGDTVYIKVNTGRYVGELDGTSRKEWVKARGTKKDADHALTIEKPGGGEVQSGDMIKIVMPLTVTNGTKVHMDIVGSAVRARYYDPRGEWQKMTIVKQEGGTIRDGDKIFIRSVFMNGRDYMDANPLEKIADGEVKCRWPDEGEWQVMTIEK